MSERAGAQAAAGAAGGGAAGAARGAGVSAEATMTSTKATRLDDDADRGAGQRVAEDEDAAGDAGDVRRGAGDGDDRDGLAVLQAAGRGVEGGGRGRRARRQSRG